ncbi:MAG: hypothetical protein JNK49_16910 [Planctomycetes bacterium]|nr:hypothetical protein [Planctomycetota bacterium]
MSKSALLPIVLQSLLATAALAQCEDNVYPLSLVSAQGVPAPRLVDPSYGGHYFQFDSEAVFLAFDPATPSGVYYVHVTDPFNGADLVLSGNDPMDRFVQVVNTNGVITLSLPFSNNQSAVFGLGLGGQGQSLLLQPFGTNPAEPCQFKVWAGDNWDLTYGPENPYLLRGGFSAALGRCAVLSYENFRIGSGIGTNVTGSVFRDDDRSGTRNGSEPGLADWEVRLVTGSTSLSTRTDANGRYVFPNVPAATYTVEVPLVAGYVGTTTLQLAVEVCGCADQNIRDFGVVAQSLRCCGHTIGFWGNCNGLRLVSGYRILPTLPGLYLRNQFGQQVAPGSAFALRSYLRMANSCNMAYMLSAQLVAMHCNVMTGLVSPHCRIRDRQLGVLTIGELMQRAIASLAQRGYTPVGSQFRREQELLKNALDAANNNRNWY